MGFKNFREFVSYLETVPGEVVYIDEPLSSRYEVAAVLGYAQKDGPAVMFSNLEGFPGWRIVGNTLGSKQRVAAAFGVPLDQVDREYLRRRDQGIPPVEVKEAPVKEITIKHDIDLTRLLPVVTFHEKDASPYITAGVCIVQQKSTGSYHVGIHRMQVKGGNRLGIFVANPHLSAYFAENEAEGKPLDVAIAIGMDPLFTFAAVTRGKGGWDKLSLAGGMRQQPVAMVQGETVSLLIPAEAEIVLEGHMLPGVREPEGPFGESSGYYFSFETPVIEITAVHHRANPIYHAIVPFGPDTENLMRVSPTGADIRQVLSEEFKSFIDFTFIPGTYCFQAALCMKNPDKLELREAAMKALWMDARIKQLTVVDEDVDIFKAEDVAWAIATRARMDEDIIIVRDMPTYPIDPGSIDGASARMIIDATMPFGEEERYRRISYDRNAMAKARQIWNKVRLSYGGTY